jgi:hypothetical protein
LGVLQTHIVTAGNAGVFTITPPNNGSLYFRVYGYWTKYLYRYDFNVTN